MAHLEFLKTRLCSIVLTVHRRNGGELEKIDLDLLLLDPSLRLDSLDLAEIMAAVEKDFGKSPFDAPEPPRTWREVVEFLR